MLQTNSDDLKISYIMENRYVQLMGQFPFSKRYNNCHSDIRCQTCTIHVEPFLHATSSIWEFSLPTSCYSASELSHLFDVFLLLEVLLIRLFSLTVFPYMFPFSSLIPLSIMIDWYDYCFFFCFCVFIDSFIWFLLLLFALFIFFGLISPLLFGCFTLYWLVCLVASLYWLFSLVVSLYIDSLFWLVLSLFSLVWSVSSSFWLLLLSTTVSLVNCYFFKWLVHLFGYYSFYGFPLCWWWY